MAEEQATIRIGIDASAAQPGANQAISAYDNVIAHCKGMASANDQAGAAFQRIGGSMGGASQEAGKLLNSLTSVKGGAAAANDNMKQLASSAEHAGGSIGGMVEHIGKATLAIAGLSFAVQGVHALVETFAEISDESVEVTSRLMSFAHSNKELADAQSLVYQVATKTRTALPEMAELFQKIGLQADHLHISLNQVAMASTVFGMTLKLSGANAQNVKSGIYQLGEAFDVGKLSGKHFQAMMTDNIEFMKLLATSLGTNTHHLGEMAKEGKITADALKNALTDPKIVDDLEKRFGRLPVSFGQVRTGIKNTLIELAGDFANGAGLNTSLGVMYANVAKLATDLKPTFEKIGVAARAAFDEIAPAAVAAWQAIKPGLNFLLDNAPTIIKLLTAAAEVWMVYKAAQMATAAVSLVSKFATEAQSLAMFLNLAKGGEGALGIFRSGLTLVAEGFNVLKVAMLANPFTALIVGVTTVVALLYEFRDSIQLGGGTMASLGDLFRAVWEKAGPLVQTVTTAVSELFDWIGDKLGGALTAVESIFGDVFGSFDFSIAGALRMGARFVDFLITGFKGWWTITKDIFGNIPGYFQFLFASAANLAIAALEGLANGARKIVNNIIGGINGAFGSHINLMADVKLGRVDTGGFKEKVASDLSKVTNSHSAENGLESILTRAGQIGAARRKAGAASAAGITPKAGPEGKGKGDGDDDADKKAKKEAEFWKTLQNELASAKLFGIEQQKATKEQELQKILGRDINAGEKERVDNLVQAIANEKAVTDVKKATFELTNKNTLASQRQLGLSEAQGKIQDALDAKKLEALNAGVDITTKDYQTALAAYKVALENNVAIEARNALIKSGVDIAKQYSTAFSMQSDLANMAKQKKDFIAAFATGDLKDAWGKPLTQATADAIIAGIDQAMQNKPLEGLSSYAGDGSLAKQMLDRNKANSSYSDAKAQLASLTLTDEARQQMSDDIERVHTKALKAADDEVADYFAQQFKDRIDKLGDLFGKIGSLIGGKLGGVVGQAGNVTKAFGDFRDSQRDVSDTIKNAFDPNGGANSLAGKIGDKVGGAVAGAGIGAEIGKLGTALGIKGSEKGATIGGAIGGAALGPLGAIGGSIIGGLISSLFYKPPSSNATFTKNADGTVGVGNVTGSNSALKAATSGAAGEVLAGLSKIASSTGGTLTGTPNLTIGTWDSKWRVLDNQQTSAALHSKNFSMGSNLHDFGSDEASAVAYAISEALKQGVITGLSDLAQKALSSLDADTAVSFIQSWSSAMSDFKSITDPIGSAVENVVTPMATLLATMTKVGASTADLTKLDEYRAAKLDQVLKQQTSSFQSILDNLNGSAGGVSALDQLTSEMATFQGYKAKLASGSTIDQSDYNTLVQKIVSNAGSVYGTSTSQYQDIVSQLKTTTTDAITAVSNAINTAAGTTGDASAQIAATNQIATNVSISNDYLGQIAAGITNLTGLLAGGGGGGGAVNGIMVQSY